MDKIDHPVPPSLFDRIGGEDAVRAIVDRFYDLMEQDPRYAELRAMHVGELLPMRMSLTLFLTAWLGGSRAWFDARPGVCVMSMHRAMGITRETAGQWVHAMRQALAASRVEPELSNQVQEAFLRMAGGMITA